MLIMDRPLYDPMPEKIEGVYFGMAEFGDLSPAAWFQAHRQRLIVPIERIAAAREPYEMNAGPEGEGVYFLFTEDRLAYVGQSKMITSRLNQHAFPTRSLIQVPWLTHYAAIWAPCMCLDAVESYYLHALRPPLNIKFLYPHRWIEDLLETR